MASFIDSLSDAWIDFTWARKERFEWLAHMNKMRRIDSFLAESRVRLLLSGHPLEWDDNIPVRWARILERKWGL